VPLKAHLLRVHGVRSGVLSARREDFDLCVAGALRPRQLLLHRDLVAAVDAVAAALGSVVRGRVDQVVTTAVVLRQVHL